MGKDVASVLRRNLRVALRSGNAEAAEDLLDRLRQEDPLSQETHGFELQALVCFGDPGEAVKLAASLGERFADSATIQFWSGRAYYKARHYDQAEACLRESARLFDQPETTRWLGKTLTQRGRFAEAEPLLLRLAETSTAAHGDLAWLYERMGDDTRALREAELALRALPGNDFYHQQVERLRARMTEPAELADEVQALADLGRDISDPVFLEYVAELVRNGRGDQARPLILERLPRLPMHAVRSLAWTLHKLSVYDLAFELFVRVLPIATKDVRLLSAVEKAARESSRIEDLVRIYGDLAQSDRRFYGRIRKLDASAKARANPR
jgi:tetratricopeptide (TPR) repeat protein